VRRWTDARVLILSMNMSEKTKPGERPAAAATGNPAEHVPDWLSSRLRRMFTDVMDEPVPDEFKALLKQLEDKERGA
jgi:Anti-sigma factor NepR